MPPKGARKRRVVRRQRGGDPPNLRLPASGGFNWDDMEDSKEPERAVVRGDAKATAPAQWYKSLGGIFNKIKTEHPISRGLRAVGLKKLASKAESIGLGRRRRRKRRAA